MAEKSFNAEVTGTFRVLRVKGLRPRRMRENLVLVAALDCEVSADGQRFP
jgi:hypothetical protein